MLAPWHKATGIMFVEFVIAIYSFYFAEVVQFILAMKLNYKKMHDVHYDVIILKATQFLGMAYL
jgi:hypothetical protein